MKSFSVIVKKKINKFNKIIHVNSDKSISHRAVILASQCVGVSHLKNVLESNDLLCTLQSLRDLGVKILRIRKGEYKIFGNGGNSYKKPKKKQLWFGNSGTSCLLLGTLAATSDFSVKINGDDSLKSRSMKKFVDPLSKIGVTFKLLNKNKTNAFPTLPLEVQGTDYLLAQHHILNSTSAQEKSVILLAGLETSGITTLEEKIPSRDHTEIFLKKIGGDIRVKKIKKHKLISLHGQKNLNNFKLSITGDPSSAAYFVCLALLTRGSHLIIRNCNINFYRTGFIRILKKSGSDIRLKNVRKNFGESTADIIVRSSNLKPIKFPVKEFSSALDEIPILVIVAALTKGVSKFQLIGKVLKNKESNRLLELKKILTQAGIQCKSTKNSMTIYGKDKNKLETQNKSIVVRTRFDHRICLSTAIFSLITGIKTKIDNFETVNSSFPDFVPLVRQLGGRLEIKKYDKSSN